MENEGAEEDHIIDNVSKKVKDINMWTTKIEVLPKLRHGKSNSHVIWGRSKAACGIISSGAPIWRRTSV